MVRISFWVTLLLAITVMAFDVPVNGVFDDVGGNGLPKGWMRNTWEGYKPDCALDVGYGEGEEGNSLRMSEIASPSGAAFNSINYYPAECGDIVSFTFRARGKGNCELALFYKTIGGAWNYKSDNRANFSVGDQWKNYSLSIVVTNGKAGETGSFNICFQAPKGGELEISDLKVDRKIGEFLGSIPFPKQWRVFGPLSQDYMPTAKELTAIPETLDGVAGQSMQLLNNKLDFAQIFGSGEKKTGWAFAELDAPYECNYTLGVGGDYWWAYYLNGELVMDTLQTGNLVEPYAFSNYKPMVRLQKGKNILAVKLITGRASSLLHLGGPLDLLYSVRKIKMAKMEWSENFDGKTAACTGNPEIIADFPTPGLLTLTGQGVFTTNKTLEIAPPQGAFKCPENNAMFRAIRLRLQKFSRQPNGGEDAMLALVLTGDNDNSVRLEIRYAVSSDDLELSVVENGNELGRRRYGKQSLPADVLFGVSAEGFFSVNVSSLSDGTTMDFSGVAQVAKLSEALLPTLELSSETGGAAEVVIDNYTIGLASDSGSGSKVPFKIDTPEYFDPVQAGWKLVFSDEFDGDTLDESKWTYGYNTQPGTVTLHDGLLDIKTDWKEDGSALQSGGIYARQDFQFGFFEARVRFVKEPGWWSAFWLNGWSDTNPFYDGFEIDCYEDYFLSSITGEKPRDVIDFNLHVNSGTFLKSWNYNGPKLTDTDAFYTIGVKWTPFEISYYMDGKLISGTAKHSPYNHVIFDAFNHALGITPIHPILSGQVRPTSAGNPRNGHFPEYFLTDFVRVYAMPREDIPEIHWTKKPANTFTATYGDTLEFSAEAAPGPAGSPIKTAYLFDSGYLVDYKTEPPYDFKVILTHEFYDMTDFVRPGRQGIVPDFTKSHHAYSIFVQDEAGNVSFTDPYVILRIRDSVSAPQSTPHNGVAQVVPGRINLVDFDDGGNGVGYFDTTPGNEFRKKNPAYRDEDADVTATDIGFVESGEWLNYTIDIQKAGTYKATVHYGYPWKFANKVILYLDEEEIGSFTLTKHEQLNHVIDMTKETTVTLPEGRHVLKFYILCNANFNYLDFDFVE